MYGLSFLMWYSHFSFFMSRSVIHSDAFHDRVIPHAARSSHMSTTQISTMVG